MALTAQAPTGAGLDLTRRLTRHVTDTAFEDFDDRTVQRAKIRLLDGLGNIAAGRRAEGSDAVAGLAARWGGAGEATVLTHGHRVPAPTAAWANAALMRSYDFEPIGAEGPDGRQVAAHITGSTVPTALAVAQRMRSTGRQLLTALILGDDVASRLAVASGFDVYSGQDNTGTVNGIGAAAVAGRLMELDAAQLGHAFGLALNQLGGTIANIFDMSLAFKLPMAFAARNAIISAELAAAGFTGPADPIGGRHGFLDMFCTSPAPELILERLGSEFYADLVIKPWAACRASHPSLDACVRIRERHAVDPARIERVVVHTTPRTLAGFVGQPFVPGSHPEVSGLFSIRFTAATALLHGTVRPEHLNRAHMEDPRLLALLERTELVGSLPPGESLTADVEVFLDDGTRLHQRIDAPRGDLSAEPPSRQDVLQKYFANTDFGGTVSRSAAEQALEIIDDLENLDAVEDLVALFSPQA